MCRKVLPALAICAVVLLALPAFADIDLGGSARSSAMGGAGLAVLDDPLATAMINPAAMALVSKRFSLQFPSFDLRARGVSISDLLDSMGNVSGSDTEGAIALAREFGGQETQLGIDLNAGVSLGTSAIAIGGQAIARINPGDAFRAWANDGTVPTNPDTGLPDPGMATAVVSGDAVNYLPSVSMGWKVPRSKSTMYMGVRGRLVQSTHYEQSLKLGDEGGGSIGIVEDGAEIKSEGNGFGMDIGMIMRADGPRQTTYGLVVTNFLHPNLTGIEQSPMVSLGFATKPSKKVMVAADLVNIFRGYGESPMLRMGVEIQATKRFALRAGLSGNSFTYGFGLFGLNLAFSSEIPMTIANTLRF